MNKNIAEIFIKTKNKKTVFVYGQFNILHPGHLRLLKFAKDNGDFLIVGVEPNHPDNTLIDSSLRIEALEHSLLVDYSFLMDKEAIEYIEELKPNIVVKGNEFENRFNLEQDIIDSYGGKLIFGSGDIRFSSLELLQNEFNILESSTIHKPLSYIKRHNLKTNRLLKIVDTFKNLNILVIGDTIIDEYKTCEPLGMSQEDPTIVVSPISSDIFLGGGGIVSAHASSLGANVDFVTILGDDENSKIAIKKMEEYNINTYIYKDKTRPTTLKQRFRANGKTLLRVNHLKQHNINNEIQDKILKDIEQNIKNKNLIVFSDFSYGCLPQNLIDNIIKLGLKHDIMMVADSQSSSQSGDISKFKNMTLITPTEREARLSVNDFESGLIVLAEKIRKKSNIKNLFITLGSEGLIMHINNKDSWETDKIVALNKLPKDVSGAGDCLLITSSMAIVLGASFVEAAYIGSLSSALQVGRIGNIPLDIDELKKELR